MNKIRCVNEPTHFHNHTLVLEKLSWDGVQEPWGWCRSINAGGQFREVFVQEAVQRRTRTRRGY